MSDRSGRVGGSYRIDETGERVLVERTREAGEEVVETAQPVVAVADDIDYETEEG